MFSELVVVGCCETIIQVVNDEENLGTDRTIPNILLDFGEAFEEIVAYVESGLFAPARNTRDLRTRETFALFYSFFDVSERCSIRFPGDIVAGRLPTQVEKIRAVDVWHFGVVGIPAVVAFMTA